MVNSEKSMKIFQEEFKQRAFDGKWERIVQIEDVDNTYVFINEYGSRQALTPLKWVTVGVYDYLMEIED